MRFHDYASARSRGVSRRDKDGGYSPDFLAQIRRMNSAEVARYMLDVMTKTLAVEFGSVEKAFLHSSKASMMTSPFLAELTWYEQERPFYNVWPIASSLLASLSLSVRWEEISFPYETILFRFPVGHEPHGLSCALIQEQSRLLNDEDMRMQLEGQLELLRRAGSASQTPDAGNLHRGEITIVFQAADSPNRIQTILPSNRGDEETVEESLMRVRNTYEPTGPSSSYEGAVAAKELLRVRVEFLYRLAVFTSLLARGHDLITPIVLSKDQEKYDAADESTRRWIEERAARVQGRGFHIGKDLEAERERSPHWRNPHLCLFWTGEGRGKPLLKLRRGGVVIPRALSEVPTGFLGAETPEELKAAEAVYARIPISARLRFEILRRDSYRCQLCGRAQSDGVRLHIDHKVAVAKGGSTSEENLWVLCEPCNLGKSDSDL
jgi:hypothetical protein